MSSSDFGNFKYLAVIGGSVAIICGIIFTVGILSGGFTDSPVVTPTTTPIAVPTDNPTPMPSPTATPTPTANHTPTPTATPTAAPTPSPTPAPEGTGFQNATLTVGEGMIDQVPTWVVNGTLVDTVTHVGLPGLAVSVVDASNSSLVYGNVTTDASGNFELTFAVMQPPTVQLVFAGNNQYLATTSEAIELPPP
jgi:hypothetical protein